MSFYGRIAATAVSILAVVALAFAPPVAEAARKKKEEAAAEETGPVFSKEFRKKAVSVQEDVIAQKWPEVLAGIEVLEALPELNDDDWRMILNWKLVASQATGDTDGLMTTLRTWLERGYATPEQKVQFNQNLAAYYSQKNDAANTMKYYAAFIETNPDPTPSEVATLSRLYFQQDDNAQGVTWMNKAIDLAKQKNEVPEELFYQLLDRAYVEMKEPGNRLTNLEELVMRYPKAEYYSRIIAIYSQSTKEDRVLMLNTYRLAMADTGLTTVGEHLSYADNALVLGSPGEALRAMERGMAAGIVPSAGSNQEVVQEAKTAIARDRKDLPRDAQAAAKDPKGEMDVKIGLGFYSIGEWNKAIEAVSRGLSKGGVKRADDANLLLGAALLEVGKYDEAKQAFAAAGAAAATNRYMARLASLWTAYADRKAGSAG